MPKSKHSKETVDGRRWIKSAFERIAKAMGKRWQWCDWKDHTFYTPARRGNSTSVG